MRKKIVPLRPTISVNKSLELYEMFHHWNILRCIDFTCLCLLWRGCQWCCDSLCSLQHLMLVFYHESIAEMNFVDLDSRPVRKFEPNQSSPPSLRMWKTWRILWQLRGNQIARPTPLWWAFLMENREKTHYRCYSIFIDQMTTSKLMVYSHQLTLNDNKSSECHDYSCHGKDHKNYEWQSTW